MIVESKFIGKRLKNLRESRRLKQSDVQKITGIHQVTVGQHESGDSVPSSDKIARFF
jgi:transcriptional regulator with XRE-family HTH domain